MECLNKKISTRELSEIIPTVCLETLQRYLSNYRFNKFRKTHTEGRNAVYEVNNEFLNTLYSLFWYRNRAKEAEKLKKHFKEFNIKVLSWEEFIRC
jgi:hypothetical protein